MLLSDDDYETLFIFLGLFFMAYVYYKRTYPVDFQGTLPPTIKSLPVIGSLPFLPNFESMHLWFMDKLPTMGGIIGFYARSKFNIVIQTRQALNDSFVKHSSDFGNRPFLYINHRILNPDGMYGIVDSPLNESFKKYHRLTLTTLREFGFGNHGVMETRINSEVEHLVAELGRHGSSPVYPKTLVNQSVVNVIASILFGRRFERSDPALAELIDNVNDLVQNASKCVVMNIFPMLRFLPRMKRRIDDMTKNNDWLAAFLTKQIVDILADGGDGGGGREASFIRSFIEAEDRDSKTRVQMTLILRDLIVAGSESSSTSVMWAIALMADHRDVQTRIQEEIDSVVGNDALGQRLPSLADRAKMPYVEATILELMRFKTIVPLGVPRETINEVEVEGYTIPAGTMAMPNLYAIHMDPNVWKDPTTFRPERFLNAMGHVIDKDKVIPFSIGKRSCLGELLAQQEIFLFITGLLQNFDIQPPEGQDFLNCTDVVGITVAPSPFKVRMTSRKKKDA